MIVIRHLVEAQVENMELDILAIPTLAIADKLAHPPFAEAASVFYYVVLPTTAATASGSSTTSPLITL